MKKKTNKQHDNFTDMLHLLLRAHTEDPTQRFGQLVSNIACKWGDWKDPDIFHCPDEQLLNGCENFLDDFKRLDNYEV